jgi:UDP-3-O-[3-hydroxymyristoyl] glucosamine N-acyltransferase
MNIILKKYIYINIQTFIINILTQGVRKGNVVIIKNNFKYFIHPSSQINLSGGNLILNDSMRVAEPFVGMLEMGRNSQINVKGVFSVYSGMHIILRDDAVLNLGSGYINRHVKIRCYSKISIGEGVAISENVTIWDSDAHVILGKETESTQPVWIGDHVWIGNNVTILKGVTIGDNAVIAAGAVVNRDIPPNCLAGGVPAKVIKEGINWK